MADIAIEDPELEIPAGDEVLEEQTEVEAEPAQTGEDEDEVLISFDGEGDSPPQSEEQDSSVIRRLREENRKKDAELRALRATQQPQSPVIEVGEKPTLAACDYDEERFEAELDAWKERGAKAKEAETQALKAQQQQLEARAKRIAEVQQQIADLKAKDFDHALDEVKSAFDPVQQEVLFRAPKKMAVVALYLGRNPATAAELAKISDPIELAAELARLEGKLTVTNKRNAPPPPEQIVRGSAPLSAPVDKHLERLEAEAARTGDRTKVVQYKRQQKAKAR